MLMIPMKYQNFTKVQIRALCAIGIASFILTLAGLFALASGHGHAHMGQPSDGPEMTYEDVNDLCPKGDKACKDMVTDAVEGFFPIDPMGWTVLDEIALQIYVLRVGDPTVRVDKKDESLRKAYLFAEHFLKNMKEVRKPYLLKEEP